MTSANFRHEFIRFALTHKVLRFGEFTTKAGRPSPYFFNAGLFHDGLALKRLAQFYVNAIAAAGVEFDILFGPAYKGIVLAAAIAMVYAEQGRVVPFSYNRKEEKDHGEGGAIVGAPLTGRVLIVDDVISAGTSVRESVNLIRTSRAIPCGVVVALDRMERGSGEKSAIQEVKQEFDMPVVSVASLDDLIGFLRTEDGMSAQLAAVDRYRATYGVRKSCMA